MKKKNEWIRWLFSCLILFLYSCGNQQQTLPRPTDSVLSQTIINKGLNELENSRAEISPADVVFRTGRDFTSETLRSLNRRDQSYSHCGIVSIENDSVFVYHALGGEWNPDQKIRRDKLTDFADPVNNSRFAVYSLRLNETERSKLLACTRSFFNKQIMFDMKFDLDSDERMYCAEFIYKAFLTATDGKVRFPTSKLEGFTFVGTDDIFLYPDCKLKRAIIFK